MMTITTNTTNNNKHSLICAFAPPATHQQSNRTKPAKPMSPVNTTTIRALDGFFTRVQDKERTAATHPASPSSPKLFKSFNLATDNWVDFEQKLADARNATMPPRDIKVVYFVRHGEGVHNEIEKEFGDAWWDTEAARSEKYLDTDLTEFGINDARSKGPPGLKVERAKGMPTIERVVVSTLSRTIQTAQNFFEGYPLASPQFVSMELCRERLGVHTPNKRVSLTKLKKKFPQVDFAFNGAAVQDEEDVLWTPTHVETDPEIQVRAVQFLEQFFREIPDTHIAVVAHYKLIWGVCAALFPHEADVTPDNCEVVPIVLERVYQTERDV